MDSILIVEDTDSLREVLCTVLSCEGYKVTGAASAEEGIEALEGEDFNLVLSDLKLPQMSGLDFLEKSKELRSGAPIVVMTAYGSIDIAVEAMKLGATDFITKPFDPSMLCNMVQQITEHNRLVDRDLAPRAHGIKQIVTHSPKMEEVLEQARRVAPLSTPVMILGESGTGKELLARYIHEHSPRTDNEFIAVNCGSMPAELLESEFFGHEAGSFTGATERRLGLFEVASDGTIFLDEIGGMPLELQIKLLRTLQESEVKRLGSNSVQKINTRVLSATNVDIEEEIKTGNFRDDLFYRLGVVVLELPPLRERQEDVALLANYFVKRFASTENDGKTYSISNDAMKALENYPWPGNVRELENVIESALIFSDGELTAKDLKLEPISIPDNPSVDLSKTLPEISQCAARIAEYSAVSKAMEQTGGNKSRAAKLLGVSYKTLLNKVKEFELGDKGKP